jgi:hypothetical protein
VTRYNTNLAAEFYVLSMLHRLGADEDREDDADEAERTRSLARQSPEYAEPTLDLLPEVIGKHAVGYDSTLL